MVNQLKTLIGILFLMILAYAGIWYTAAFQAEKDVTKMLSSWRDQGLLIEHGKIEHGGFPYRITVDIKDLTVATRAQGLVVTAKNIKLISHVWTPGHWLADVSAFNVTAAKSNSIIGGTSLIASYRKHDNGKSIISFESSYSTGFYMDRFLGQQASAPDSWKLFLQFDETDKNSKNGLYAARFLDFKLETSGRGSSFSLTAGLSGPAIKDWSKNQLGNWVNEGGLLDIDSMSFNAGANYINGKGSLTLDDQYRPLGSLSMSSLGGTVISNRLIDFGLPLLSPIPGRGNFSFTLQNGTAQIEEKPLILLKKLID